MGTWLRVGTGGLVVMVALGCESEGAVPDRLNGMVALQDADQPVFGLYAPRAAPRRGRGAPPPDPSELKTPMELAHETMGYASSDYVFNSSMERGVEQGLPAFQDFMDAMLESGATAREHPLIVKMQKISEDPDFATLSKYLRSSGDEFPSVKMALLGDSSTQLLSQAIRGNTRGDLLFLGTLEDSQESLIDRPRLLLALLGSPAREFPVHVAEAASIDHVVRRVHDAPAM